MTIPAGPPPVNSPSPAGADTAIVYVWASPDVGLSADGQAERIRRHCEAQRWIIRSELRARRFPELTELTQRLVQDDARRVVLVRETLLNLERRFPDAWRGVRSRVEARGAVIVAV